jgi:O-antigen ligase
VTGAGVLLVALAVLSAGWSVDPRLSFARGISLALVFLAAVLLASAAEPERVVAGLIAGAVVVALAGILVLGFDHAAAVAPASYEVPARYEGVGENPNTVPLLLSLALPLALGIALVRRTRRGRAGAAAAALLFAASIVASGSRGALAAATVGAVVVVSLAFRDNRHRVLGLAAVLAVALVGAWIESIPQPTPITPRPAAAAKQPAPKPKPKPRYLDANGYYPLDADVGGPLPGGGQPTIRRTFFASSGRLTAWAGAFHQALERPLLGFGFGTEAKVFVDRYYYFVGGVPENAYVGLMLQLGIVGLLAFIVLVGVLAWTGARSLRGVTEAWAVAAYGALAAGLAAAVAQSYFYSAGDIATLTLWSSAFLLPVAVSGKQQ